MDKAKSGLAWAKKSITKSMGDSDPVADMVKSADKIVGKAASGASNAVMGAAKGMEHMAKDASKSLK